MLQQHGAVFAHGDQHRFAAPAFQEELPCLHGRIPKLTGPGVLCSSQRFGRVRHHDGDTRHWLCPGRMRVPHHRHTGGSVDERCPDLRVRGHSADVIGDDDRARRGNGGQHVSATARGGCGGTPFVETDHGMRADTNVCLHWGPGQWRSGEQGHAGQCAPDVGGAVVVRDSGDQRDVVAVPGEDGRHQTRPAGPTPNIGDVHHRHRSVGAEPGGAPVDVHVE